MRTLLYIWNTSTAWALDSEVQLTRRDRPRDPHRDTLDLALQIVSIFRWNWNFHTLISVIRCTFWNLYFSKNFRLSPENLQL